MKDLARFLGPLANQTSLLLAFAVSALRQYRNYRSVLIDAARGVSAEWTRDHVVLRVSDLLQVASDVKNLEDEDHAPKVYTVASILLDILVLDEAMHEMMLEKNFIVSRLLSTFWQVVKLREGRERQALFDSLISTVTR